MEISALKRSRRWMNVLTDEERKRIFEEEKARLEAREQLGREGKAKKSKRVNYGCLTVIVIAVGVVVVANLVSTPKRGKAVLATDPSGRRYLKAPEHPLNPTTDIVPIMHIKHLLNVAAGDIKSTLKKELGSSASIEYGENCWGGKGWTAKTGLATIEVTPWKGRILEVMVHFNPPVRDRAAALAYIDLQPCTRSPDLDAVGASTWKYAFDGIYRVIAARVGGGPSISVITVTPSKALDDEFTSEN
jgi:hypothetical protein